MGTSSKINLLSARFAETVATPGRHADGQNLYLSVSKTGSRRWVYMYSRAGKQKELGLGGFPAVSLKEARAAAAAARQLLNSGIDPLEHKRSIQPPPVATEAIKAKPTFGEFALELLNGKTETDGIGKQTKTPGLKAGFRNAKHAEQWESTLKEYAKPLWPLQLDAIGTDEVLKCLQPIWTTKAETASRVRGRIEAVLTAAIARKLRPAPNPASWQGNLEALLPKRHKLQKGHHAALHYDQAPAFWEKLSKLASVSAMALQFTILTAARSGEARGATWSEMDLEQGVWTVPAVRMKAGREHLVPLSDAALKVLEAVQALRLTGEPGELVFPSIRARRPLTDMAMPQCLRGIDPEITVHGFRSTFRDWGANKTEYARELMEEALAHSLGAVEAAYRRGAAVERRRPMMQDWADFLTTKQRETIHNDA